jgi:2-polyprenyl-3-methyl-5-hydroxy-6-metoxy-1,4-benzoquinol methylase
MKIGNDDISRVCDEILERIDIDGFASHLGVSADEALSKLMMALGEARQTLSLLTAIEVEEEAVILEVGAGLGMATLALSLLGFNVTGLEPGGVGFESNQHASRHLFAITDNAVTMVHETAEAVTFPKLTKFDLVISNNVLEHVADFEQALKNLALSLSSSGIMIHSCPNYSFPYEPHFGFPLVPLAPRLTKVLLPNKVSTSGLWKSLNFITAIKVNRCLRDTEFIVKFRKGTMSRSFVRLGTDAEFKNRHPLLGRLALNRVSHFFLRKLLSLPYWMATPMDFIIIHKSLSHDERVVNWLNQR